MSVNFSVAATTASLTTSASFPATPVPSSTVLSPWPNSTYNGTSPLSTNSTPARVQPCLTEWLGIWALVFLTSGYILIFAIATLVNSIIIYVVLKYRNTKTAFNYLIVNLAASDILHAVVVCPLSIGAFFYKGVFPGGDFGLAVCKLQAYLLTVPISVSVLTMTVISFDRYLAIVHPLKRALSVKAVTWVVSFIWLASGALFAYEIVRFKLLPLGNGDVICGVDWGFGPGIESSLAKADMMIKLVLHYILPLLIMVVLYTIILLYLWQRKAPGEFNDSHQKRLEIQKRKVIKMLVTIVTVFAVCWVTVHVNHVMVVVDRQMFDCQVPLWVIMFMYMVAHSNAAINPCLYLVFNQSFREGFKNIFNKVHRRQITISERNSTIREVISGATAIPNSGYEPFTPKLTSKTLNTSAGSDNSGYSGQSAADIADSRV
ncbi:neuromedin-K receptor isoform X2 [Nematostella vectensis]|nr:neuromedin-K receptor isoform X2 [Nematostella vectensis]